MKVIDSKENECDKFIDSIRDEFKDMKLSDCIFIGIMSDGSSDMYHTTMKTSQMVYQLEKAKLSAFDLFDE